MDKKRENEKPDLLRLVSGVLGSVGGVYAVTESLPVTVVAAVVAVVVAAPTVLRPR